MRRDQFDGQKEVTAWRASGQSMARFASDRGYSRWFLKKWAREQRELKLSTTPEFVRVEVVSAAAGLIVEVGRARIRVEAGFDGVLLRQVIAALEGAA